MAVAGASRFLNQATLANLQGGNLQGTTSNSLLSGFDTSSSSLLEIGKQFSAPGIGLSARARASTSAFLSQSQAGVNVILSASAQATIDGAQTKILALQSSLPASSIGSFSARFDRDDNEFNTLGSNVDQTA